jgi:hypothetical protein
MPRSMTRSMAEAAAVKPEPPALELLRAAAAGGAEDPADPRWREARERWGNRPLLRIVDAAKGSDEIVALPALKGMAELALDGCCLIRHAAGDGHLHRP